MGGACALHAIFLIGGFQRQRDQPRDAPLQRLQWRLVPPQALPAPALEQAPSPREPSAATNTRGPRTKAAVRQEGTWAPTMTPIDNATATTPSAQSFPESNQTESSRPAPSQTPLQLQLPISPPDRPSTRSPLGQALNDARGNSRSTTLEDRIAQATTGNDALQVDVLGEGRKRVHLNGRCLDVHQARISQIDPMNEVSQRAMPGVKRCDR